MPLVTFRVWKGEGFRGGQEYFVKALVAGRSGSISEQTGLKFGPTPNWDKKLELHVDMRGADSWADFELQVQAWEDDPEDGRHKAGETIVELGSLRSSPLEKVWRKLSGSAAELCISAHCDSSDDGNAYSRAGRSMTEAASSGWQLPRLQG
eukprot:PLAT3308.3.p3 GENE.PLAT3308.3~~PLAT3308.3.p3  ORF type:complete len:151 (+),score=32.87 PLAT3308.3:372-824(+)